MALNDILDQVRGELEDALETFSSTTWGKTVAVRRVFKHRVEVALTDLPIIMITVPSVEGATWRPAERDYRPTMRLYCGFHQTDPEVAQSQLVLFDEAIEDTLLSLKEANNLPAGTEDIDPKNSVTDEGYFHPVYFFVKDVEIDIVRTLS